MIPHRSPAPAHPGGSAEDRLPADEWPAGRLMSAVTRRVEREWNTWLDQWDLNHASLPVLYLLAAGPMSQRELATATEVTEQTMSRILVRLERLEYIHRRTHHLDRRRHEVLLTDRGRTALAEAGDPQIAEAMTLRGLDDAQVEALRQILLIMFSQGAEHAAPDDGAQDCND